MQKFLRTLMLAALLLPFASHAQNTLTVADGTTTNSYVPVYGYYADAYLRSQTLYPASEISASAGSFQMTGGTITSLTYYLSSTASEAWTGTWEVKVMETTATTLSAFADMTGATTVYTGTLDGTVSPMTITFDTSYTYSGGNLIIEVSETTTGNYKSCSFYGVNSTGASWQGYSYSDWAGITGSAQNFIPKTTFTFTGGTQVTCAPVENLAVSNITSTGATLTWSGNASGYTVYEYANADSNGYMYTDTVADFNTLQPNTVYTFGVVADCGADGESAMRTITFRTACGIESMPWSENFDAWDSKSPCWSFLSGAYNMGGGTPAANSSAWNLSSAYGDYITISGNALTMNIYSTNRYWAVTPLIEITNDALLTVDVAVAAWSAATPNYDADDTLAIAISTDGGATFTNLRVLGNTELNALTGTFTTLYIPVTGYTGDTVRFAFFGGSSASGGDNRIAIDNITVSVNSGDVCYPPTNLTVSDITTSGATLSWNGTADGYTIYDMSDTTVYQYSTDTTVDLYALDAMTAYTFGVAANCGSNESSIVTISFNTPCTAATLPFTEGFEATSNTRGCWTASGSANWTFTTGDYSASTGAYEGTLNAKVSASDYTSTALLVSPVLDNVSDMQLTFAHIQRAWSGDVDELRVFTRTSASGTWDTVAEYTSAIEAWTVETLNLSGAIYQVAFEFVSGYGYGVAIDSVVFDLPPACMPVSNLAVDSTTTTSVFLSWNGTASAYNIYSATGAVVATGVTTTNYEVTGLAAMTSYTFGVTAVCGTDESAVVTVNALTACTGDPCFVEINGADSYGDGWNGNAINVMQAGLLMGTFTVYDSLNSAHITVCSGTPVTLTWVAGNYPGEASFEIKNGVGMIVYTGTGSISMATGDTIFTIDNACPSCVSASALTVDAATETSITISWTGTAASYDVYNGETFVANVTTNSYTFTGLTAATSYVFGVQAICSTTDTASLVTINASTACADITTLPYNEGFENGLGCWTTINGSSDGQPWTINNLAALSNVAPHGGNYVASSWSWSSSAFHANAWLISPKFVLPTVAAGDSITLTWWEIANTNYPDSYSVVLSTTTADTASFTTVVRPYGVAAGDWTMQSVDLTAYAGQNVYIAFHHQDYDENYLLIDDISIFQGAYVPPAPDTVTVVFQVNDATMGTTIPAPGTYQYISGDSVFFGSQANAGYRFQMWEIIWGNGADAEIDTLDANYANGYYIPANSLMQYGTVTFKAYFEAGNPDSTTITYAVNDATMGTTTPAPGTYTIYVGNSITAEATANAGYELTAWVFDIYQGGSIYSSDTITSDDPDFSNPMVFGTLPQSFADYDATITVTAVFAPATVTTYTVIVRTSNGEMGDVTPAGINTVNAGESFTVTATPNEGYHFVNWTTGTDVVSTANPYTFTVTENINLIANFEPNDSTLTYYEVSVISANNEMGTVSSDVAVGQVAEGTVITVTATANEGYRFVNWVTDGGAVVSTENPYTFTVTGNVNLIAVFESIEGIDDVEGNDFTVYSIDNRIVVKGVENMPVYVYDVTGRSVKNVAKATETVEFTVPSAGVYLVKVANAAAKRVVVVR